MKLERVATAGAAFFLAVGVAGPPLDAVRVLGALAICAIVALSGRFIAAGAFVAVLLAGWLQHGHLRLALLAAAAALGIVVRVWGAKPRAAIVIALAATATGTAWLFLG